MYFSWRNSRALLCSGLLLRSQVDAQRSGDADAAPARSGLPWALDNLLHAVETMQVDYFDLTLGTWPSAIDWTAAVLGTQVSATLAAIASTVNYGYAECRDVLYWDNLVNRYFTHITAFYFGEDAFALRNQAYDDMLWVVLGWLENVKFSSLYTKTYWRVQDSSANPAWHGTQLAPQAAHRARIFWELASKGWETSLCGGGMIWNPTLEPYKNAITNELYIAASAAMYIYFPGDNNPSPFSGVLYPAHDPKYLDAAKTAYDWLKNSNMTNPFGLYQDGYHVTGWESPDDPGTRKCDDLDSMVYTYNQGVVLSGLKGLWIATNNHSYLDDGHALIQAVVNATGWPDEESTTWSGLGRGGVLEEYCDSIGDCSQDGQTFKGIFFHHLTEFCRPLWDSEREFMDSDGGSGLDQTVYEYHEYMCLQYSSWIERNAQAAVRTKDEEGLFGTWWGQRYPTAYNDSEARLAPLPIPSLPHGATDYRNHPEQSWTGNSNNNSTSRLQSQSQLHRRSNSNQSPLQTHISSTSDPADVNNRGRGRTVETQSGGIAVLRAQWLWQELIGKTAEDGQRAAMMTVQV